VGWGAPAPAPAAALTSERGLREGAVRATACEEGMGGLGGLVRSRVPSDWATRWETGPDGPVADGN
jgi:hypothetical protein